MTIAERIKETYQLYKVNKDGLNIGYIDNPSEKVQMVAVKRNLGNITLINNPSEKVQIYVAEHDPFSVSLYPSTEKAQMTAIRQDPTVLVHIANPSKALCKAALENIFPNKELDTAFTVDEVKSFVSRIKETTSENERVNMLEEFIEDINYKRNIYVRAIRILESNAPERIFEEEFWILRTKFSFEENQLSEAINDLESGIRYNEPRMLSDNHFKKKEIQSCAQYYAAQIKSDFTPEDLDVFLKKLKSTSNLPNGKLPTIEKAFSLFKEEYNGRELNVDVEIRKDRLKDKNILYDISKKGESGIDRHYYNDEKFMKSFFERYGKLKEITNEILKQNDLYRGGSEEEIYFAEKELDILEDKLKSVAEQYLEQLEITKEGELLHAGTHPYSPNYKKMFEQIGLKNEFEKFEQACCEKARWMHNYTFAKASHDIPDIGDLEGRLEGINEKINNSRELISYKLHDMLSNNIECESKSNIIGGQLDQLGVIQDQQQYIQELLRYGKTSDLVSIKANVLGQEIAAQVRLSIQECENPEIKLHFIRKDLKEDLEQPFMGHSFTLAQKENLIKNSNAGEIISLLNENGQRTKVLVSIDSLTKELIATPVEKIIIPNQFRGVQLNEDQRKTLIEGKAVHITGIENERISYGVTLQYNVDKGKVVSLANSNKIAIIAGATLSEHQSELLRNGETVQVAGLIDDKGERYSAFVKIDYPKENLIITPTNDYKIQVKHNNQGEKTEKNKYDENSVIKSGKADVSRKKQSKRMM